MYIFHKVKYTHSTKCYISFKPVKCKDYLWKAEIVYSTVNLECTDFLYAAHSLIF